MKFILLNRDRAGETIELQGPSMGIGREADNEISIDDDGVSGYHARIFVENGTCRIQDLESTNGTKINDQVITDQCMLNTGNIVEIGVQKLRFVGEEEVPGQVPPGSQPQVTPEPPSPVISPVPEPVGEPAPAPTQPETPSAPQPVVEQTTPEPIIQPPAAPQPVVEPPAPAPEPVVETPAPQPIVEPPAPAPEPVVETPAPVPEPPPTPEPVVTPPPEAPQFAEPAVSAVEVVGTPAEPSGPETPVTPPATTESPAMEPIPPAATFNPPKSNLPPTETSLPAAKDPIAPPTAPQGGLPDINPHSKPMSTLKETVETDIPIFDPQAIKVQANQDQQLSELEQSAPVSAPPEPEEVTEKSSGKRKILIAVAIVAVAVLLGIILIVVAVFSFFLNPDDSEITNGTGKIQEALEETALVDAVFDGKVDDVRTLLEEGKSADTTNDDGETLLMIAVSKVGDEHLQIVELLLENGADIDAKDKAGKTVMHHLEKAKNAKAGTAIREFQQKAKETPPAKAPKAEAATEKAEEKK